MLTFLEIACEAPNSRALRERNQSLEAEVINLKVSREAAEERARSDLGLIGNSETFYQVVPAATATATDN